MWKYSLQSPYTKSRHSRMKFYCNHDITFYATYVKSWNITRAGWKGTVALTFVCLWTILQTAVEVTWKSSHLRIHCSSKIRRQNGSLSTDNTSSTKCCQYYVKYRRYEGRSINKLQNSVILLFFKNIKIRNIRFVGNLILSTSCEFYHYDVTVTQVINNNYGNIAVKVVP